MKNQNITRTAYIVTADYYTNGKPTTCTITVQPVSFDPARLIDWSDRISKTHTREVENFTTLEEAVQRMQEITEAAAEHAAAQCRPTRQTAPRPRITDLAALPAVHA